MDLIDYNIRQLAIVNGQQLVKIVDMARYRPNDKNSITVDPTKDDGSSVLETDDEHRQLRNLVTTEHTSSSTPSARSAGPTEVEQAIDGFDEDRLRGSTAIASVVHGDRVCVTSGAQRGPERHHWGQVPG